MKKSSPANLTTTLPMRIPLSNFTRCTNQNPSILEPKSRTQRKLQHEPPQSHLLSISRKNSASMQKVFDEQALYRLPAHRPWDHAIELIPNAPPWKWTGIYSLTPLEEQALKEWLHDSLKKGYIRPSKSPMASSFFFVAKKDGKLRPVQNYIPLNDIMVKNEAPLPLISDLLDKLRGARYFTKLDVRWGYNNIRIREGDEWKAAFKTKFGLFEPLVMTFGLCNAPATFQTIMQNIFDNLIDKGHVIVYLDDILIFHNSPTQLTSLTHEVLCRFLKWDLYLKPKKCSFAKTP